MFNLLLDYPSFTEELQIVRSTTLESLTQVSTVMGADQILASQNLVRRVPIAENVVEYAVKLVQATRPATSDNAMVRDFVAYGAGPRASQYLVLGAKARAAITGRPTPEIADVVAVTLPVLRHRIVTNFNAEAEGVSVDTIISSLVAGMAR